MANLATKVITFFLILVFTFNVTSGIKISCAGVSKSITQPETVSMVDSLKVQIGQITVDNLASMGITALGLVFANNFFIFAGLSTTFVNILTFQQTAINTNLGCLGTGFVSLFSNIMNALLLFAVISWFGNKSGEAP
jgi:hypothetical protein